jgi:hypothetical protein
MVWPYLDGRTILNGHRVFSASLKFFSLFGGGRITSIPPRLIRGWFSRLFCKGNDSNNL